MNRIACMFGIGLAVFFSAVEARCESARDKARNLENQARKALDGKDYGAAVEKYKKAIAAWKALQTALQPDPDITKSINRCSTNYHYALGRPAYLELERGDSLFRQKKFREAEAAYRQALSKYRAAYKTLKHRSFETNIKYLQQKHGIAYFKFALPSRAPAPPFDLESIRRGRVRLADFHGKPVLLVIWASWCGHCKREIPALEQFYRKHRKNGLVIVGLSTEKASNGNVTAARKMASKVSYPMAWTTKQINDQYPITGYPTMLWVDRNGHFFRAASGWKQPDLDRDLSEILKVPESSKPTQTAPPRKSIARQTPRNSKSIGEPKSGSFPLKDIGITIRLPDGWEFQDGKAGIFVGKRVAPMNESRYRPVIIVSGKKYNGSKIEFFQMGYVAGLIQNYAKKGWRKVNETKSKWNGVPACDIRFELNDFVLMQRISPNSKRDRLIVVTVMAHRDQMPVVTRELRSLFENSAVH